MNWRATLGVAERNHDPNARYTHNTQNHHDPTVTAYCADSAHGDTIDTCNPDLARLPADTFSCADTAESASRPSVEQESWLLEVLATACRGLAISPRAFRRTLTVDDVFDWHSGVLSSAELKTYAAATAQRQAMDRGEQPAHYTERAICKYCGPIWLWFVGEVLGCPWCQNRGANLPIPRPIPVHCGDCLHFQRIEHPHLGHCQQGEPEAAAGLWDSTHRRCLWFRVRMNTQQLAFNPTCQLISVKSGGHDGRPG